MYKIHMLKIKDFDEIKKLSLNCVLINSYVSMKKENCLKYVELLTIVCDIVKISAWGHGSSSDQSFTIKKIFILGLNCRFEGLRLGRGSKG